MFHIVSEFASTPANRAKDFKLIENMSDLQKIAPHQKRVSIDSQFIESDSESWSLGPVSMNTNSSTHRW